MKGFVSEMDPRTTGDVMRFTAVGGGRRQASTPSITASATADMARLGDRLDGQQSLAAVIHAKGNSWREAWQSGNESLPIKHRKATQLSIAAHQRIIVC